MIQYRKRYFSWIYYCYNIIRHNQKKLLKFSGSGWEATETRGVKLVNQTTRITFSFRKIGQLITAFGLLFETETRNSFLHMILLPWDVWLLHFSIHKCAWPLYLVTTIWMQNETTVVYAQHLLLLHLLEDKRKSLIWEACFWYN